MNFVNIIKKFNMNNIDNYYKMTNKNKTLLIMPSYAYQSLIIVTIYRKRTVMKGIYTKQVIAFKAIHINDLEKLILAFIESKWTQIIKYLGSSKYFIILKSSFLNSLISDKPVPLFHYIISFDEIMNKEIIILEFNNGFYKLPNTNTYIYAQFQYLFNINDWDIISMYKNLYQYIAEYEYILDLIDSNGNICLPENLNDIESLHLQINFSRKQFNDITSRLGTIFDILNINQFRKDNQNEFC